MTPPLAKIYGKQHPGRVHTGQRRCQPLHMQKSLGVGDAFKFLRGPQAQRLLGTFSMTPAPLMMECFYRPLYVSEGAPAESTDECRSCLCGLLTSAGVGEMHLRFTGALQLQQL